MDKARILVVDDEPMMLQLVTAMLKRTGDWDIKTVPDGETALQALEEGDFSVIISDVNMPGIGGSELIAQVSEKYPQIVRLMYSGRFDEDVAIKAVETAHQFFHKPTDIKNMIQCVKRSLFLQDMLPDDGLRKIVSEVKNLPSIPDVYLAVEKELSKPDAGVAELGKIIEQDAAMSAKVMHMINSAFFGLRERVTRPADAVSLLGINILKSLLLIAHIFEEWEGLTVSGFSLSELWTHSLGVANAAKAIAKDAGLEKEECDDAFVAGMFHDIGKLVLAANLPDDYSKVRTVMMKEQIFYCHAEKEVLGATHAEVGAYLLGIWGFYDAVVHTAAFHHNPAKLQAEKMTPVLAVHIANYFNHEGRNSDVMPFDAIDETYLESLGLKEKLPEWQEVALREC